MAHLWVRAEQRDHEQRVGITPEGVRSLIEAGHLVTVEQSKSRAIPISEFAATGCNVADENAWVDAPEDAIVFGLKELNVNGPALRHRHIMFGHAYKGQAEGRALLNRFKSGGGVLYDLEYLTDKNERRIAAFGYWAGFAGAAVGLMVWLDQQRNHGDPKIQVDVFQSSEKLVETLRNDLDDVTVGGIERPNAIVIGALGRVGSGASDLFAQLGIETTKWDMEETAHGGPFPEILDHNLFVNCILANPNVPIFVQKDAVDSDRRLSVIADVSCDPSSSYNPIPIYDSVTSFEDARRRICFAQSPLDVTAIDNLPSMLPIESSMDYAAQLLPYLMELDDMASGVWGRARQTFNTHIANLGA